MDTRGIVNFVKQNGDTVISIGTGFFIAPNGYILTCLHVLDDAGIDPNTYIVKYKFENSENVLTATLLDSNRDYDIALLSTPELCNVNYELTKDKLYFGTHCYTAGFPRTSTKLSPSRPLLEMLIDGNKKIKMNEANDISGGFSGAPLLNNNGKVIGVIVSTPEILRSEGNMLNIAHAVPSKIIIKCFSTYIGSPTAEFLTPEKRRDIIIQYLANLKMGCSEKLKEIQSNVYPLEGLVFEQKTKKQYSADLVDLRTNYQPYDENGEPYERKDDICKCINGLNKKVVLLGEPGSGKSVSLLKLTIEFAELALSDEDESILVPILIPLGSYKENITPLEYVKKCMAAETDYVDDIFIPNHCLFIFDALNEVATNKRSDVVKFIISLNRYVVSCRSLDYKKEFSNQSDVAQIEILDLDLPRIKKAINYIKRNGSRTDLWTAMGGNDALIAFWNYLSKEGKSELFWKTPNTIRKSELSAIKDDSNINEFESWIDMHNKGLMSLCRNPMLMRMIYNLYLQKGANLPENRGKLFEQFVDECLESELRKIAAKAEKEYNERKQLKENTLAVLTNLAELIIVNKQGTGILYQEGRSILESQFSETVISEAEKFARDAGILISDDEYRFIHQLHQEYFASRSLREVFKTGDPKAAELFNQTEWWELSGWEESSVILAGTLDPKELKDFLIWLSNIQPKLVIRCIENAGIAGLTAESLDASVKNAIVNGWLTRLECENEGIQSRIHLGQALSKLGDPRIGVNTIKTGKYERPEIAWVNSGSESLHVSKYPITVCQYASFVYADDGYTNDDNWTISIESKEWHNSRKAKPLLPELSNAPIINISWYDAVAFCTWLSRKCNETIRLPSEEEWIQYINTSKSILSTITDKDLDEMNDTEKMVSVGLSVNRIDIDQAVDVGLVWEWCYDIFGQKPADLGTVNPLSLPTCILKGGSWRYSGKYKTSKYRFRTYASHVGIDIGFRVVKEINQQKE